MRFNLQGLSGDIFVDIISSSEDVFSTKGVPMLALEIVSTKQFMQQLLAADTFDIFLLEEAAIHTANTFHIDGHIHQEFYYNEEEGATSLPTSPQGAPYTLRPWADIKPLCFQLIKGKRTPLFFRFVLHFMPERAASLLEAYHCDIPSDQVKALVLNIRFDGAKVVLTTGTALSTFTLSKEADTIWDKALCRYLDKKGIEYVIL
jgi:hypothetical protein